MSCGRITVLSNQGHHTPHAFVPKTGAVARLLLDDTDVGEVVVKGWDSSWTYGHFTPTAEFSRFAPLFGVWSLLMHNDEDQPLHETAAAALAAAERKMDAIRAEVHFVEEDLRHPVAELNIDGELVEWKHF